MLRPCMILSRKRIVVTERKGPRCEVVVALIWVGLSLNPHPLKTLRVRHPQADDGGGAYLFRKVSDSFGLKVTGFV